MQCYEFKVIPAPRKGEKARGIKTVEDRFALTLTNVMNELGRDGWDYVRADALPVDERVGFTGTRTIFQNVLVFRRVLDADAAAQGVAANTPAPLGAPRLPGAAEAPAGLAPALGPANPRLAAE